jgi:hypothetical protein
MRLSWRPAVATLMSGLAVGPGIARVGTPPRVSFDLPSGNWRAQCNFFADEAGAAGYGRPRCVATRRELCLPDGRHRVRLPRGSSMAVVHRKPSIGG